MALYIYTQPHYRREELLDRPGKGELQVKAQTKENLVLFVVSKLYIKYQSLKDGLCKKIHNLSFFLYIEIKT